MSRCANGAWGISTAMVLTFCLERSKPFTTRDVMDFLCADDPDALSARSVRRALDRLLGLGVVLWLGKGDRREGVWLSMVVWRPAEETDALMDEWDRRDVPAVEG